MLQSRHKNCSYFIRQWMMFGSKSVLFVAIRNKTDALLFVFSCLIAKLSLINNCTLFSTFNKEICIKS